MAKKGRNKGLGFEATPMVVGRDSSKQSSDDIHIANLSQTHHGDDCDPKQDDLALFRQEVCTNIDQLVALMA